MGVRTDKATTLLKLLREGKLAKAQLTPSECELVQVLLIQEALQGEPLPSVVVRRPDPVVHVVEEVVPPLVVVPAVVEKKPLIGKWTNGHRKRHRVA